MSEEVKAPAMLTARPCRACGTMIYDLRHLDTGRHAPIEVEPVTNGNVVVDLEAGTYRLAGIDFRYPVGVRHRNHFAACPEAAKFRAGRPKHGR